jgi:hypothetical protein
MIRGTRHGDAEYTHDFNYRCYVSGKWALQRAQDVLTVHPLLCFVSVCESIVSLSFQNMLTNCLLLCSVTAGEFAVQLFVGGA